MGHDLDKFELKILHRVRWKHRLHNGLYRGRVHFVLHLCARSLMIHIGGK